LTLFDPAVTRAAADDLAGRDPIFARALAEAGPLPAPEPRPLGFAGLLRIVLEQQVSTAAGLAMYAKLLAAVPDLRPESFLDISDDTLRASGFSRQKMAYARGLARALADGGLDLERLHSAPDAEAMAMLTALKGFGRWSAEVYLLLHLGRPDLWPVDDLAVQIGVQELAGLPARPHRKELDAMAEAWRPHRSTAARLVWHWYVNARVRPRRPRAGTP
jgi:DNA-3-methyladenine glycosylase II